jgi:23S rRNA (uridine2552-2'-O)-methyltransferase
LGQSKSSHRWLREHFSDEYVLRAQAEGYRSRSCYKLMELDDKYRLIKPGMRIVDLGAAPGGWSQVAVKRAGGTGRVIASDILEMPPIEGVQFLCGDFAEDRIYKQLCDLLGDGGADLVISDMAPNLSGVKGVDQPRLMALVDLALDFAVGALGKGGTFVTKIFHGEGFDEFIKLCREHFDQVKIYKPKSSRSRSSEVYVVARGRKSS